MKCGVLAGFALGSVAGWAIAVGTGHRSAPSGAQVDLSELASRDTVTKPDAPATLRPLGAAPVVRPDLKDFGGTSSATHSTGSDTARATSTTGHHALPATVIDPVRTVDEALRLAARPLTRAEAEQYVEDKFGGYFKELQPPLTAAQRTAATDYVNSRLHEFYTPELAEISLRGRLPVEVLSELTQRQNRAHWEAARHIATYVLTPEQRKALSRYGLWRSASEGLDS